MNASGVPAYVDLVSTGKNALTYQPTSPYPAITTPIVFNGGAELEIDGSLAGAGANGFVLQAPGSQVISTLIHGFDGAGIWINEGGHTVINSTIRNNGGAGIAVVSGDNNSIRTNSIFDNGGLGIDLMENGVTPNDVGDADVGPNQLQNSPVILAATAENTHITGLIDTTPNTEITIDFFTSPTCDASGFGEGSAWFGSAVVVTDNLGAAQFDELLGDVTFGGPDVGDAVTATATGPGGTSEFSECFIAVTTDIERDESAEIPTGYELFQNYPNPFNPVTNIRFAVSSRAWVILEVYDILGKRVATLVDGYVEPGEFTVEFDAEDLPSGIYLYRMTAGAFTVSKQLTLLK